MAGREPLTIAEKERIYYGKLAGKRLADLATEMDCSVECARKWWRIGRDGGLAALHQQRPVARQKGALSRFAPIVAERALFWKQRYPRRGADRILVELNDDEQVQGLKLPRASTLAGFFKQACSELLQKRRPRPKRPPRPGRVHQLWQVDAKEKILLGDGTIATVLQAREPVGCVFLGCFAHAVQTERHWRKLSRTEIQADLRQVFGHFGLPEAIQTDRERVYGRPATECFPSLFSLWLVGLGIAHHFTRPAQATDQAQVERGHRTWNDWLIQPDPSPNLVTYQAQLDRACYMHNQVLTSQAGDCNGRTPYQAHPEVWRPIRSFVPEAEWLLFQLERVDRFLAQFQWQHKVTVSGQAFIGQHVYYVGQQYAGLQAQVCFEPQSRHFVFTHPQTRKLLKRCPAKGLDVQTITGLQPENQPDLAHPFQLSLPF